jgi:hypothetical protein
MDDEYWEFGLDSLNARKLLNGKLKLRRIHVTKLCRFLKSSSGYGKCKLYLEPFRSMKMQPSGLCHFGPLATVVWDLLSILVTTLQIVHGALFLGSEHQFGREWPRPEVWTSIL